MWRNIGLMIRVVGLRPDGTIDLDTAKQYAEGFDLQKISERISELYPAAQLMAAQRVKELTGPGRTQTLSDLEEIIKLTEMIGSHDAYDDHLSPELRSQLTRVSAHGEDTLDKENSDSKLSPWWSQQNHDEALNRLFLAMKTNNLTANFTCTPS
jgi:hypothetical protein